MVDLFNFGTQPQHIKHINNFKKSVVAYCDAKGLRFRLADHTNARGQSVSVFIDTPESYYFNFVYSTPYVRYSTKAGKIKDPEVITNFITRGKHLKFS